jgi:hypothetical protein
LAWHCTGKTDNTFGALISRRNFFQSDAFTAKVMGARLPFPSVPHPPLRAFRPDLPECVEVIIDRALACLDQVSRWVNDFEAEGCLPSHAGEDARSMAEQLRDLLSARSLEGISCAPSILVRSRGR